ncbi:hypothetical protein PM082_019193 [Marasmius tenuissimus]|nr:hypothetical protein PM082_019193 [Marasmius tenuissimus]
MDTMLEAMVAEQDSGGPGIEKLVKCLYGERLSSGVAMASAVLFLYDYLLTFSDEIDYIWSSRRLSPTTVSFFFSRYSALATAIMTLIPFTKTLQGDRFATILRMVAIVSSEAIVAIRTWAIWSNSKRMFCILSALAIACLAPSIAVVIVGVVSSQDRVLVPKTMEWKLGCTTVLSQIGNVYIVPYSMAIFFESVNLALSLARILRWRRNIPSMGRASLIDTLYRDGINYFSWMIVLSSVNIAIIVQTEVSQLRVGGTQLQAGFHSMLATRMILHVARLSAKEMTLALDPPHASRAARTLGNSGCATSTQFTSFFASEGNPSLYRDNGLVVPEIPKLPLSGYPRDNG